MKTRNGAGISGDGIRRRLCITRFKRHTNYVLSSLSSVVLTKLLKYIA